MIKAVIFDLNGVFIQSPKLSDRFCGEFKVPVEEFMLALNGIMAKVRKPNAGSAFNYWKPYFNKWGVNMSEAEFFDFWFGSEKEVPELIESAKQIKAKGIKIFILSNNFAERAAYYEKKFLFLNIFDKVYYSWQTGFVKPNQKAFEMLLSENGLRAEECIYFDNSPKNIEAASDLGIKSFLFKKTSDLEKTLKKII